MASIDKTRLDDGEKGVSEESSSTTSSIVNMEYDKDDEVVELPSPASSPAPSKPKMKLTAAAIIPVWMALSTGVIIYNNYLYNTLQFKYPVFLVTWHLIFAVRVKVISIRLYLKEICFFFRRSGRGF